MRVSNDPGFDMFDPRTWSDDLPYLPIWIDPELNLFTVVDRIDYDWAIGHLWQYNFNGRGKKIYCKRSVRVGEIVTTQYLHKAILLKMSPQKDSQHMGDHINGNSLDNRRINLRWATPSENARNRKHG